MGFRERTPSPYHRTRGSGARRSGGCHLSLLTTPFVLAPLLFLLLFLFVSIVSGFSADEAGGSSGQRFDHPSPSQAPRGGPYPPRGRPGHSLHPEGHSGARLDTRNENKLLKNIVSHSFLFVCQDELATLCPDSANKLQCLLAAAQAKRVLHSTSPPENDSRHASQDAVFSPECVNWLFSRQICLEAVRELAQSGDNPNCSKDEHPRQCLRQVPAALLPPACVHSSYYISVQSAGIVQRRAERPQ